MDNSKSTHAGGMLTAPAHAKLNLFLEVTGKRADAFHDIDSVFLEIDLADSLSVTEAEPGELSLFCDQSWVPLDSSNLILKAATALGRAAGVNLGARFTLTKRIPAGAGLGGGSTDAAAALRLLNTLWKIGAADKDLAEIGAGVGSDVPFFLTGGTCRCRGRGEIIQPLPPFPAGVTLGLVLPGIHSSTAAAYKALALPAPGEIRSADEFIHCMRSGDVAGMQSSAFNRFESVVFGLLPELARLHSSAEAESGRPVRLTGTGSGMWFFGSADGIRSKSCRAARGIV